MRLHTDVLTENGIRVAATKAGATCYRLDRYGSRSRARAFDVILEGCGRRGGQWGGDYQSATWDQWGIFFAALFEQDPAMKCYAYDGADHLHWVTANRFRTLTPDAGHILHRWAYQGQSAGGSYFVHECKCGAITRRLSYGEWANLADVEDVA